MILYILDQESVGLWFSLFDSCSQEEDGLEQSTDDVESDVEVVVWITKIIFAV